MRDWYGSRENTKTGTAHGTQGTQKDTETTTEEVADMQHKTETTPPVDRDVYPYDNPHGYPRRDPAEVAQALKRNRQTLMECGCCGGFHRRAYCGDCRNDAERFDFTVADARGVLAAQVTA